MERVSVLGVAICLLFASSSAGQDSLTQAHDAYRRGDFRSAATLFEQAAEEERDPSRRAEIRVRAAVSHFNSRNRRKAEETLAAALRDAPQLELLRDFYADDFLALFAQVKRRLAQPPTPPPVAAPTPQAGAVAGVGPLAALRQQLVQAIDNPALESILQEVELAESSLPSAELPQLLQLKAEVLERLGRGEEALEQRGRVMAMRAAARALPGSPVVPFDALQEARLLLAQHQPHSAEALLRGVLAILPACQEAYGLQGEALLEGGKLDEAFSHLRTALLGNDERPGLWLLLGEVEARRRRLPAARDAFLRATNIDPRSDRAWAALGLLAAQMDDRSTAREALDRALQANGTLFEARVVRAQLSLVDGDVSDTLQHLQRALQVRPDDPWTTGWMGAAYLLGDNPLLAIDKLRVGVAAGSRSLTLLLAEALRRAGRLEEALEALVDAEPHEFHARLLRARCLLDSGDAHAAATLLQGLATLRPADAVVHYLLGHALHTEKKWRAAQRELEIAASLEDPPSRTHEGLALVSATVKAQNLLDNAVAVPPPPPRR